MTVESPIDPLTDEQKNDVCVVVSSGCDRETAAKYARTTWAAVQASINADPAFAVRVRRAEAVVELNHMLNIREAGKHESNWRTSVWWLERLAPERYGPRDTGAVTARQLKVFVEQLAASLVGDIEREDDRRRVLKRLHDTAHSLERLLRDEGVPPEPPLAGEDLTAEQPSRSNTEAWKRNGNVP